MSAHAQSTGCNSKYSIIWEAVYALDVSPPSEQKRQCFTGNGGGRFAVGPGDSSTDQQR